MSINDEAPSRQSQIEDRYGGCESSHPLPKSSVLTLIPAAARSRAVAGPRKGYHRLL